MQNGFDEFFDAIFCRPLGRAIAVALSKTSVTPNKVTLATGNSQFDALPLFAGGGYWPLCGAAVLLTIMVLDCTDGELARMKGGHWTGRVLDGFADTTCAISAHLGMLLRVGPSQTRRRRLHARLCRAVRYRICGWRVDGLELLRLRWSQARRQRRQSRRRHRKYRGRANTPWLRFVFRSWENHVRKIARYRSWGESREHRHIMYHRASLAGPTHHHLASCSPRF